MSTIDSNNRNNIIQKYITACKAHGIASQAGKYKIANKEYSILLEIYKELEKNISIAEEIFKELLENKDIHVKIWASSHSLVLKIEKDKAEKNLIEISKMQGIGTLRLDAEMTLKQWREGKLKF